VVIALAGRRVDAPNAETARFPLANVPMVSQRLDELFQREATALVCSAACGADLVALKVAGTRGMRRRIVLPFDRDRFRVTSVIDRPGDWGPLYDRILNELDIVTLEGLGEGNAAYIATNHEILRNAIALARQGNDQAIATLVWEGASRGSDDVTASFGNDASALGLRVVHVKTL
jgi:hypothetical protein